MSANKISLKVLGGDSNEEYSFNEKKIKEETKNKNNKIAIKFNTKQEIKLKLNPINTESSVSNDSEEKLEELIFEETDEVTEESDIILDNKYEIYTTDGYNTEDSLDEEEFLFEETIDDETEEDVLDNILEDNLEEIQEKDQEVDITPPTFIGSLKNLFKNIFKFKGKTDKKEYLFSFLWIMILSFVVGVISSILASIFAPLMLITPLIFLVITIAQLSLNCRRFNDMGMYWWTGLLPFVLGLISFVIIIALCVSSLPLIITNTSLIVMSLMNSFIFITLSGLVLSIVNIWQLILFIVKRSDFYKDKKITNYIIIGLTTLGYVLLILAFVLGFNSNSYTINSSTNSTQNSIEISNK